LKPNSITGLLATGPELCSVGVRNNEVVAAAAAEE